MADEQQLATNLNTYEVQLEQVEAALTSDTSNAELLKLKGDLQEVITLTTNLLEAQASAASSNAGQGSQSSNAEPSAVKAWKVGDECLAMWSEDSQWYDATIDAITDDGLVAVSFEGYGNSDVTKLSVLKERIPGEKRGGPHPQALSSDLDRNKLQRKRKQKQKKHDRQKFIDEMHDQEKAKWLAFSSKVKGTKKLKGVTKKSIFATPDAANGRVGIGTCGIGGKPMTEYTHAEKWRKGT